MNDSRIKFLIWGDGDEKEELDERIKSEHITNVAFKGRVDKKYIPFITSHADVNLMNGLENPIFRFGISPNKLFDYFAAGKPILCNFSSKYNPVITEKAGLEYDPNKPGDFAEKLSEILTTESDAIGNNGRRAVEKKYNFNAMTDTLEKILRKTTE